VLLRSRCRCRRLRCQAVLRRWLVCRGGTRTGDSERFRRVHRAHCLSRLSHGARPSPSQFETCLAGGVALRRGHTQRRQGYARRVLRRDGADHRPGGAHLPRRQPSAGWSSRPVHWALTGCSGAGSVSLTELMRHRGAFHPNATARRRLASGDDGGCTSQRHSLTTAGSPGHRRATSTGYPTAVASCIGTPSGGCGARCTPRSYLWSATIRLGIPSTPPPTALHRSIRGLGTHRCVYVPQLQPALQT